LKDENKKYAKAYFKINEYYSIAKIKFSLLTIKSIKKRKSNILSKRTD